MTACCDLHLPNERHPDADCCDPNDCGPCCENCPTCPSLQRGQRRPGTDDAFTISEGNYAVDGGWECPSCGEEFEVGERAVLVPIHTARRLAVFHLSCGLREGEVAP